MELTASQQRREIGAVLDRLSDLKKAAEKHRVKIRSVHLPFFPFEEIDPADRDVSKRGNFIRTQLKILQAAALPRFIPAPSLIRMQRGRSGSACHRKSSDAAKSGGSMRDATGHREPSPNLYGAGRQRDGADLKRSGRNRGYGKRGTTKS